MYDMSIPMMSLAMRAESLENMPKYELPEEYGWRYFQPGDEKIWAEIETSAGEFEKPEDALKRFRFYYPTDDALDQRMIFLTDNGVPFATATAWYSDDRKDGRLHWVSVDEAHQGRGLSKPLISLAMHRIRELGYEKAELTTHTASWVAIRIYYRYGFRPLIRDEKEIEGWKIISEKAGVDFLKKD